MAQGWVEGVHSVHPPTCPEISVGQDLCLEIMLSSIVEAGFVRLTCGINLFKVNF